MLRGFEYESGFVFVEGRNIIAFLAVRPIESRVI
jgi:hypothetical protein